MDGASCGGETGNTREEFVQQAKEVHVEQDDISSAVDGFGGNAVMKKVH